MYRTVLNNNIKGELIYVFVSNFSAIVEALIR